MRVPHRPVRVIAVLLFGGLALTACDEPPTAPDRVEVPAVDARKIGGTVYDPAADFTDDWTIAEAQSVMLTADNTAPMIDAATVTDLAPDLYVWDTWPLRDRDGGVASVNGWRVIFSLTSTNDILPGARHDVAEIRYFYSRNGRDWTLGGVALDRAEGLGTRQWAGSAMVDESGQLYLFYTASGREGGPLTYEQRIALAKGKRFEVSSHGVSLVGSWSFNDIILVADGELYQTQEQSAGGIIYSFRDPWYFRHPDTGEDYILFEGNSPLASVDDIPCEPGPIDGGDYLSGNGSTEVGQAEFNGSVGIARATNAGLTDWELLPPLMQAVCVNQQLERPHLVLKGGLYYLFIISHKFTFAPGIGDKPDGLYGFVGPGLRSDYTPLNQGGLVVANPPSEPFQAYSWLMLPNGFAESFFNYFDLGGIDLREVGDQSPEFQRSHFGGTLAPTLKVAIRGARTSITAELDDGFIPGSGNL